MFDETLLIWKLNLGRRDVLPAIYERYKDDLVTLATALLYDKSAAEDVVHDVFAGFIASAPRFRLTGSLKGYLSVCVANGARNWNKAQRRHRAAATVDPEPTAPSRCRPDRAALFSEDLKNLAAALAGLPFEQREVVLLHLYSGVKFRAIAETQGVSINTVQGRYRYGLDKLRTMLNGEVSQ
ncbi:MAG: sigma-70 family RNA polymerase sigma factor [Phycisphaerae bacterium]|nr:sigma-70 family RNA polymerase sigma factor [Phycisphaerae bacterium]